MIKSFQIQNFRQIKSLEFESLGRVNLITGKNNTGKTSVLEALHIYGSKQTEKYPSCFVHNRISEKLDEYWNKVNFTPKEDKVIKALQIIDPRIERLNFVNGERKKRKGIIKFGSDNTQYPLERTGEGINRILAVILALVNAENGFLLVDEFENSLHFSVQEKLWEIIFKTAEQLNIQVFATTHSNDCVSAFAKVQQDLEYNDTKLFRMYLDKNGDIKYRNFSNEDLSIILEQGIEIRN